MAQANADPADAPPAARRTISCFLCGGTHIFPGPRYENHLLNEHGVVFDIDFIIQVSLYKQDHGIVPVIQAEGGKKGLTNGHKDDAELKDSDSQTELDDGSSSNLCSQCRTPISDDDDDGRSSAEMIVQSKFKNGKVNNHAKRSIKISNVTSLDHEDNSMEVDFNDGIAGLDDDEDEAEDQYGEDPAYLRDHVMDESDVTSPKEEAGKVVTAWHCPLCPKIYKRHSYFKQHACIAHELEQEDIAGISAVQMTEEDFLRQQEVAEKGGDGHVISPKNAAGHRRSDSPRSDSFMVDKRKRKPIGKEWAPNSFSSTFTCYFCNEQFRKDYKLKLHLMLNHSPDDMSRAKEELTKSKLDGCVHKCALCGSKYNSVANFTRHVKDVHNMSRAQYSEDYGYSEVVSRMFKCELCEKEVKHTRNIIGAHMKMVHLISWREYQDILMKLRQGETIGDLPAPELFDCIICGVSIKYKREHLNKKHQITEDVYDELIAKKNRGEDISEALPEREVYKCLICDRECLDIKKHIERSHQLTEEMYEDIVASKSVENKHNVKQMTSEGSSSSAGFAGHQIRRRKDGTVASKPGPKAKKNSMEAFPQIVESPSQCNSAGVTVSTDLQCFFGCDEVFKKDYQLYLHLKLRHRNEDPAEVKKAYEAADEEIALTRRSGSIYQCALCNKQFNDNGAFYSHIQTRHNMQWREYKDKFGRCEIESSPFECKICNRVIKYDRNTVHTHLKYVHGINWTIYLDRIRKLRRGEIPDDLPMIEMTECRVCNINVKYLKDHLRNAHKITEQEYESLFKDDDDENGPGFGDNSCSSMDNIIPPIKPKINASNHVESRPVIVSSAPQMMNANVAKPPKSDIQDKTNKKCTTCSITFDSRRSFIEHCTTVHNMKFKTKSGITISAPSMMRQQQQPSKPTTPAPSLQGTKRKSVESHSQFRQVPSSGPSSAKKSKTVTTKEGSYEIEYDSGGGMDCMDDNDGLDEAGNLHRGPQYTPSGVSKWNQCRYECCFCKKTTMSRSSMTSHIHNTHGIPIKEYKESNYPDIEVETNWFQCRLCSARTKFVKDCISPHLKMSHNMDIEVYEHEFMQPEDWPQHTGPRSTMRREPGSSAASSTTAAPTQRKSDQQGPSFGHLLPEELPEAVQAAKEDRWNKCKFRCCLCEWVSIDSRQMRAHIATNHGITHEQYVKQYGTTEVVSKRFRCDLCNSEMKHCRQNIYAHMKDVHKLSLAEYEERVGMGNDEYAEEMEVNGSMHVPTVPFLSPASAAANAKPNLVDNGNQPSRWNRCRFQCSICLKLSSEKRHTREHIVKIHGLSMPDYEAQYGDCEIHTEYFFCGVCHAEVKHNLKNVSLHLQNVHHMSSQQYEEQFGRLPDDEVVIEQFQSIQQRNDDQGEEEELGFGAHFLLDEEEQEQPALVSISAPPRSDVTNPSCKFCRTCNRDFNRRQAFVEHCRNVHGMKIKFARHSGTKKSRPIQNKATAAAPRQDWHNTSDVGGHPCDYCGKVFSNISNRNRHVILSCEIRKNGGSGGVSSLANSSLVGGGEQFDGGEEETPSPEKSTREPQKCPYPDCETVHVRSALMKRHLFEAHNIQNVSVHLPDLETEKRKIMNIKTEPFDATVEDPAGHNKEEVDERKVPPLRVKLSGLSPPPVSADVVKSSADVVKPPSKEVVQCSYCPFKTNNAYILNRHKNACLKRKQSADSLLPAERMGEEELADDLQEASKVEESQSCEVSEEAEAQKAGDDGCEEVLNATEDVENDPSNDAIEVSVDFEDTTTDPAASSTEDAKIPDGSAEDNPDASASADSVLQDIEDEEMVASYIAASSISGDADDDSEVSKEDGVKKMSA